MKDDRINVRVDTGTKRWFELNAERRGMNISEFLHYLRAYVTDTQKNGTFSGKDD